jgi:hypothetical protein
MNIASFESKLKQLDQQQMLTGAISSLNRLLVDKGIVNEDDTGLFSALDERTQTSEEKPAAQKSPLKTEPLGGMK